MDIFSLEFLSALGAIILIDLVLAGDNALVIAMAARKLPPVEQKKAIVWGTVGAIAVRSVMTLGVVWLLKIPGLLLAGGLLLVWISIKLLVGDQNEHEHGDGKSEVSLMSAMKTIVIADAVMGVDNVLGVAGAAQGSFLLVVLGLLISIPIVVWCSSLVLRLIERFPQIIYLGSGVLAWTAAQMIFSEPFVLTFLGSVSRFNWLFDIFVIAGVLSFGYLRKRKTSGS